VGRVCATFGRALGVGLGSLAIALAQSKIAMASIAAVLTVFIVIEFMIVALGDENG